MKTFIVYENYEGKIQAVEKGVCMMGGLFSWVWALFSGLYVPVIGWWAGFLIVHSYDMAAGPYVDSGDGLSIPYTFFYGLIMLVVFAAYGNKWKGAELLRKGYERKGEINTKSPEMACHYYKDWKQANEEMTHV